MTRRYLIVVDYSLGYLGGAQIAVMRQASALAQAGHQVTVLAPGATRFARELRKDGVALMDPPTVRALPAVQLPLYVANNHLKAWLIDRVTAIAPHAVLIHSEFGLAAAAMRVAQRAGIPVVHTVHTFFWRAPAWAAPLSPMFRLAHRFATGLLAPPRRLAARPFDSALRQATLAAACQADWVVSPSHHQGETLRSAGVQRLSVISNTTPVDTTVPASTFSLTNTRPLQMVWAARFAPEKRLEVAVEAISIANVTAGREVVQLHVAGGSVEPRAGVTFHGRVDSARVRELITSADAVIITSVGFDNQPMIALEAFGSGRPVIVSDPVLAREFGDAAVAAPGTSALDLATAFLALVKDPQQLRAAAKAARVRASEQTPGAHAEAIDELVSDLMKGRRNSEVLLGQAVPRSRLKN